MAVALLVGRDEQETKQFDWFIRDFQQQLLAREPLLDLRLWPKLGNVEEIEFALVWRHALGALAKLPNLKCIASLGAGVDHLVVDPELRDSVPIIRVMDPYMANDIVQYVLTYVLNHIKRADHWMENQKKQVWLKQPPFSFAEKTIGIMGLGFLGKKAALALQHIGLNVIGWSNSAKNLVGIKDFVGESQFPDFLSKTDILVCMVPLTPQTKHILNQQTFATLKKGALLINLGRGDHLVEKDLLNALDSGQLCGACLDVFSEEPLPSKHPFWSHPLIRVTPHIASVTNPATVASQLLDNFRRLMSGEALLNQVDLGRGY
jgi:glyoxylate/hydroxypyruvate reductase A